MSETVVREQPQEVLVIPSRKITMSDLLEDAHRIQSRCEDYSIDKVSGRNFRIDPSTANVNYIPSNSLDARSRPLTKHSMSQLCTKLGVPSRYIDKCISEGHTALAADNLNAWADEYRKPLFIREYGNHIRAVLSDRYMVLDTPQILEPLQYLVDPNLFTIKSYFLSEERFQARIVLSEMLKIHGEDLFAGVQIDSSDVGRSIVNIQFLIYKQVCTNGMVIAHSSFELFSKRHLGNSNEVYIQQFEEAFSKLPGMISQVSTLVSNSNYPDKAYNLQGVDFSDPERKPLRIETFLRDRYNFSAPEVENVMRILQSGAYPQSRWGFVNSITDAAKSYTLERRSALEKMAGHILLAA